jgi:hypothetical protein
MPQPASILIPGQSSASRKSTSSSAKLPKKAVSKSTSPNTGKKNKKAKEKKDYGEKILEKRPPLSEEFVVDSDDVEEPKPEKKNIKKRAQVKDPKPSNSATTTSKSQGIVKRVRIESPPPKSSEDESEDEDTSEEESESEKDVPQPAKSTPVKQPNGISAADDEKSGSEELDSGEENVQPTNQTSEQKPNEDETGEEESENDIDAESASGSSEEEDAPAKTITPAKAQNSIQSSKKSTDLYSADQSRPAPPFKPPPGFKSLQTSSNSDPALKLFKQSNLAGKQVWYLTAPASLPITTLHEISMENIEKGESVISHQDSQYGFVPNNDNSKSTTVVMLPGNGGYKPGNFIALISPIDVPKKLTK